MRRNMRAERARLGLSLDDVARAVGVNKNSVQRWETGEVEPVSENLQKLSDLYGCTVEYLLEQTDDRTKKVVATKG